MGQDKEKSTLPELEKLPGQKIDASPRLRYLFSQACKECNRNVNFAVISSNEDFLGRFEWRDTDILIEIRDNLDNPTAEYVAAHELCHVLQLARGYPIAGGRADDPRAVAIAIHITDFVFDSFADAMAVEFGFPMASGFEHWIKSTGILEIIKKPKNGRRYGDNWTKIWEKLKAIRVSQQLGLKLPRLPREFWTLWIAFDFANIIQRATNLNLTIGIEIGENIKRVPLLSRVVHDFLNIGAPSGICNVEESTSKLINIFRYIQVQPGHIYIHKPMTDEIYTDGIWQPRPKQDNTTGGFIERLLNMREQFHKSSLPSAL